MCFQSDGIVPEDKDFLKYDRQNRGYFVIAFFKDPTMDFIWAFGFVRVDISKELFKTTALYVFHLGIGT